QHLLTLPRACWASVPNVGRELYDVPAAPRRDALFTRVKAFREETKQVYDIPASPEKAGTQKDAPGSNVKPDVSENGSQKKCWGHYNTLPNPRKSEWIYDIPVSPEKKGIKQSPLGHSLENAVLYDIPPARYRALMTNTEAKAATPQLYDVPPPQNKAVFPDVPLYDVPSSRDMLLLRPNATQDVAPSHSTPKAENGTAEGNVYDIPKALQCRKETGKHNKSSGDQAYHVPPQLSRDVKLDEDRVSLSSVDRTSTTSTSSGSSAESFSVSSSDEPGKEIKLDLEGAIETLTRLQHGVSSSVASLMIFVSSKWRLQENLEKNIEEIHRAVDHIKVSMGEFLAFAQVVKANASYVTDNNLQTRIKKQLEILVNSFQILIETREALNNCNWSLEELVMKKPQNNPDDLDRFVMVARTIPDDIKRFVSIIIANGKLLFRKNDKEQEMKPSKMNTEYKMAKQITLPRRTEVDSLQRNDKPNHSQVFPDKPKENAIEDCDYVLPTAKRNIIHSKQDSAKKIPLSEHRRLCFGALSKAIGVFTDSLSNNQPPEIFISHSKLIIMVGQKLVDSLCQETQEKDARNDILHSSSRFCSLLKNLALATKNAAIQYPNADATRELQNRTDELSKYIQQFRAMME
ncbi:Cas scaffolding protein family member 4, partial [Tinamus guttatus]